MADSDEQIRSLLEEALNSGRTPEEVCTRSPEHLDEVRRRWRRIQNLAGDIERVFPATTVSEPGFNWATSTTGLPDIPGYVLESVIGHGGMGVVYKARHIKLDRVVALKMLRGGDRASQRELASLLREARAIAGLKHPHIVEVHDVGDVDGSGLPYFTMEFIENGSLARRLDGKPLLAREAAALVASLADAVQAAHAGGIVHRDLKPANILMARNECPKIADFGLARRTQGDPTSTLSPAAAGTPSYMAPEQALGTLEAFGPSVDVYALGAVLYELLTGKPPFCAHSNAETQRMVISEEPVAPSRLNPEVPRDLEIICLKCLQKVPSRRYATARDVSDEMGRFLRGEPISARPVGQVERLRKWVRRRPGHAAAIAGAVVAVVAIAGAMLWTFSQRAAIVRAASEDLAEVVRLEEASDWRGARNMLERAKTRLGATAGRGRLAAQAVDIERELDLVDRLVAMRFDQRASADLEFNKSKWWNEYRRAFLGTALLAEGDTPDAFAARVARSPARAALVVAMDDMAACAATDADREWILSATRLADPDPWRDRARDSTLWRDPAALAALAREAPVEAQPPTVLLNLAGLLLEAGSPEAESLIRRVQAAHPSDFWANFALAETLDAREDADAIGFYRAAIAIRPQASVAHFNIAYALAAQGRVDEAIDSMRRAATLDPSIWSVHYSLAMWQLRQGRPEAALEPARIANQIPHPHQHLSHGVLGSALVKLGRYCEAAESYRRALALTPDDEQLRRRVEHVTHQCEAASSQPSTPTGP